MNGYDREGLMRTAGTRMAGIARESGDAEIPRYPGKTVLDVLRHTGLIHRRTSVVVAQSLQERPDPVSDPAGDLVEWFTEGLTEMIEVLAAADPEHPVWGFGPDPTVGFWIRRMAVETDVHRWDCESALGAPLPFGAEVAVDGIDELSIMSLPSLALGDEQMPGPVVTFEPIDAAASWTLHEDSDGYRLERGGKAKAVVRGAVSDIFLALFGRGHGLLDESGPPTAHAHWRSIVSRLGDAGV